MAGPWEKYAEGAQPQQQFHPAVDSIIGVESAGNPNARNPRSSAAGLGQFIDSTWQQFIQERHPQRLQRGEDIFALKTDPNLSREATDWYAKKNESFLQSKGLPTDPGAVYLAHFAGPGGAEKVLRASPEASAADILGRDVVNANPFLANMSAQDVQNWARQKVGGEGETQVAGPWEKYQQQDAQQPDLFGESGAAPAGPWERYKDAEGVAAPQQERGVGGDGPTDAAPAGEIGVGGPESPPVVGPDQPGLFDDLEAPAFWQQSMVDTEKAITMARIETGRLSPEEGARELLALNERDQNIERRERYKEAMRKFQTPEYSGWKGALKRIIDYPDVALEQLGESSLYTAIGGAGAVTGAAIGGMVGGPFAPVTAPIGGAVGAFSTGMGQEYASQMLEVLEAEGIDVTNEDSLAGAFANPELMSRARERAGKKALPVAVFDTLAVYIGMRGGGKTMVDTLERTFGRKAVEKSAAREAVEEGSALLLGVDAPAGMAGEAGSSLIVGEPLEPYNIMLEGFGEIAMGGPLTAAEVAIARHGRAMERPPATEDQIKKIFTAVTDTPSYEEAEAQGRKWFGFVEQDYGNAAEQKTIEEVHTGRRFTGNTLDEAYQQARAAGVDLNTTTVREVQTSGGQTRVYSDYTKAEEIMGQEDPRTGKLVAADENDITATSADAANQVSDPKLAPTPRFTDPAREPEARRLWDEFVTSGRQDHYREAVKEGLRLTPMVDHAEFVGDTTANEILPKSELPIRGGVYELVMGDGTIVHTQPSMALNTETLLQDDRFVLYPDKSALERLAQKPNAPQLAASLFKVNNPQLQETLTREGWTGLLRELAALPRAEQRELFTSKWIQMRPSLAWGDRFFLPNASLKVWTSLGENEAKAALETRHKATIPEGEGTGGPAIATEEQAPHIGSAINSFGWDFYPPTPPKAGTVALFHDDTSSDEFKQMLQTWKTVAERILKGLGIKKSLIVLSGPNAAKGFTGNSMAAWAMTTLNSDGFMADTSTGDVLIYIPERGPSGMKSIDMLWTIASHEFGHALSYFTLTTQPTKLQAQIFAAYRRYVMTYRDGQFGKRDHQNRRSFAFAIPKIIGGGTSDYHLKFEEWFAEQVARWSTTSAQPVGAAAKYFRRLGRAIIRSVRQFAEALNVTTASLKPEPVIQQWLDSAYRGERSPWAAGVQQSLIERTRAANLKHGVDTTLQAESVKTHAVLDNSLGATGNAPPNTPPANTGQHSPGAQRAQSDRFNWLMKWGLGFKQLAQENPHIRPLQLYAELMKMSRLEVNNIMADAEAILKQHVRRLRRVKTAGRSQADRLADFLFDMTEMNYRNTDEVRKNVRRNPTAEEFQRFAKKHQLSQEAIEAYGEIRDFFAEVVMRGEEVAIAEARAVFHNNPQQLQIAIGQARMMTQRLLAAPYFPMTRFGHWAVTVRTASGGIEVFETYETQKEQQKALAEAHRRYPTAQGWSVTASTLPEEAQSFSGMPPWFLDKLQQMPGTTQEQQEWLQLLRYQVSPARSFRKHLLPRRRIAGHSRDLERIFARYAFQHARHYGRVKYQRALEAQIKQLRSEFVQYGAGLHDVNKRTRMADFLEDHFKSVMNPGPDWHFLRSATSVWYLGFMVSSAVLNMTQTVLMTFPQLGARFGDLKASGALIKASTDLTNYYKRGSYEGQTQGHFKMLDFLIKRGDITESMAAELAGLASGNALDSYMGFSDVAHRGWLAFADKAMLLFKLVEQWNRRVTARAAYDLAVGDINNPAVQEVKNEFFLQYQRMVAEGFGSDSEILATLFAGKMIDSTQYDYSKEARPRFMRGRKGLLFAFYMFTQNTVFQLAHKENRGLFTRYALIMMFLAGPMGLMPDEAEDVLNFVARRFFGKQFDLRLEARKFVNELTGNPKWTDGILHGTGRYSFGIPHLLESMGGPDLPEVDFSRLVELRNIAPLPLSKGLDMIDRGVNAEKAMSRFVQDTAGAGFGLPFQWMMAALDGELALTDLKRWERGMPRALKKVSETWRRLYEGGERVGSNNYIMEYDKTDPQDVAELVAGALGFTPTRQALQWDVSMAQREQAAFWKAQRQALLNTAFQARFYYKDAESWKKAREDIVDYNKRVPDPKLRITGDTIKKSFTTRRRRQQEFLHRDGPNVPARLGHDVAKEFPEVRRVGEQKLKRGGL